MKIYATYPTTTLNLSPFIAETGYVSRETIYVTATIRIQRDTYANFIIDGTIVATVQNNGSGDEIFQVNILLPKGSATKFVYGGSGTAMIETMRPMFTLGNFS